MALRGLGKIKNISHILSIGYHGSGAIGHLLARDAEISRYPGLKGRVPVILL